MKKRILSLILMATLSSTLMVGCGSTGKTEVEEPAEKVTIKYANWNLGTKEDNNIERKMIKEWNDAHPKIQVEVDESLDYSKYQESLTAAASAGTLPDVISLPNIPLGLTNEWLANINDIASKDKEWKKIPKPLEEATHFGKGVYAVPFGMFFQGYFVNDDVFEKANLDPLKFAPSVDEFFEAVKATSNPSEGVLGISESVQIPDWYAAAKNKKLGWYTFDGSKFNLDSEEYKEGINKAKEVLNNKYGFDALTDDEKGKLNVKWHGDLWNQGKVAMRWEGTWCTVDFSKQNFKNRFIGIPGGRTTVVGDFLGISKSSKDVKSSYNFAKFMSFSKDGILKKIELGASDNSFNSLPLTSDKDVLDKYFETFKYEGIKEAFDTIDKGIVEGVKVVPGYVPARWEAQTGIKVGDKDNAKIGEVIDGARLGQIKIEDVAGELNKLANSEYDKGTQSIKGLTDK